MTSPTITLRGRLARAAELRTRMAARTGQPGSYVLQIELSPAADGGLPLQAELVLGECSPALYLCASARLKSLRAGAEVAVQAEGFRLEHSGRGRQRTSTLRLTGVRAIEPTARPTSAANDFHHQLDDRRYAAG